MLWASSKEYENLVGEQLGWSRVPAGKRASTYEIPEYQKAAAAFGDITLKSIESADPANPGVQPRPTVGIQFVAIPEFQDLGTKVSQDISAAIAGDGNVGEALDERPEARRGRRRRSTRSSLSHGGGGRRAAVPGTTPRPVRPVTSSEDVEGDMTTLAPPADPSRTVDPRRSGQGRWRRRAPLLPALIFTIVVTQLPFLVTLVISTLHWNILRPGERSFAGLTNYATGLHRRAAARRRAQHRRAHRVGRRAQRGPRARPGGAARPQVPRPRAGPHPADRAVPGHAGRGGAAVEARHLQPDYGLLNGTLNWIASSSAEQRPHDRLGVDLPDAGRRDRAGVAVDAVHDADPAGRPAGAAR